MIDWRVVVPGAAAADGIRRWIDLRITEIEGGRVRQARSALDDPGWRFEFDVEGVPISALARLDDCIGTAGSALADGQTLVDAALEALRAARRVVTPGG